MGHATLRMSVTHGHGAGVRQPSSLPALRSQAHPNEQPLTQLALAAPLLRTTQPPCTETFYPQHPL